jgi:serine phosphatase RsbU (regulator of sigma subunit)/CheY-like chemotaxis protein
MTERLQADAPGVLLVVDDDEAKRYLLSTWLRRAGHQIVEATTGDEALAKVGEAELVVLDVNLPDMSGFEVCRQIKADPRTAAIPVVQVSATAVAVADRAHGLTQGADAYLIEPAEPEELVAVVRAALRYYRARQRAERTASLLNTLVSVTLEINEAETFNGLARAAVAGTTRIFSTAAVLIIELPDGQVRRMSAVPDTTPPVVQGGPAGLADRIADEVIGQAASSMATTFAQDKWLNLVPDSPLREDVRVAAARTKPGIPPVIIAVPDRGLQGEEEAQILRQLVQSVALGIEALRSYAEEHLIALTLQRSFLPSKLPQVDGIELASRYVPASDQAEVGGDFYEALVAGDRLLVAIGDVQGHSLHAATIMGELRHALRAFASEGRSPLEITGLVNDVLRRYHPGIIATLCLVLVDPPTGQLEITNCGHMPVLLVDGNGASYIAQGGLMLGLPMHDPHTETAVLPAGGTALLITDGLVEDRKVLLAANLERLRAAAQDAAGADIEAFTNQLMSIFGPSEDDVAMIALRRLA